MTNEELVQLYQSGDMKAMDKLTEKNIRLIQFIANKCCRDSCRDYIDYDDFAQLAWFGFSKAVRTYRCNNPKSSAFSTWAAFCIRQHVFRYAEDKKDEISLQETVFKDRDDYTLEETLEDYEAVHKMWRAVELKELREELNNLMKKHLTLRESEVIKLRVGWFDNREWDFEEISRFLNGTKKNIYRDYCRGIEKLKATYWAKERIQEEYARQKAVLAYRDPISGLNLYYLEHKIL